MDVRRGTRAIARWILLDAGDEANGTAETPDPVVLANVELDPGELLTIRHSVRVPDGLGRWALVIDVVDDVDGAYSALGSQPAVAIIEVVAPRGREVVQ